MLIEHLGGKALVHNFTKLFRVAFSNKPPERIDEQRSNNPSHCNNLGRLGSVGGSATTGEDAGREDKNSVKTRGCLIFPTVGFSLAFFPAVGFNHARNGYIRTYTTHIHHTHAHTYAHLLIHVTPDFFFFFGALFCFPGGLKMPVGVGSSEMWFRRSRSTPSPRNPLPVSSARLAGRVDMSCTQP